VKRSGRRIITIILVLLLLLTAAVLGGAMIYRSVLADYFSNSEPVCSVPDISSGFIPQGLAYDPGSGSLFISGYMDNFSQSPMYVIGLESNSVPRKVNMLTESGDSFRGHSGGISVYDGKVFVAGSTKACVYSVSTSVLLNAADGGDLSARNRISLKNDEDYIRASFTSVDENSLYIGEFHKSPIFYTHRSHLVEQDGVRQKAYLAGFRIDDDMQAMPVCVYSIPDNVQGACFSDGYVYLSRSHGFLPADILSYDLSEVKQAGTKSVLGKEIPLYVLAEGNASKITKIPPMSEEIVVVDGRMLILYEAASNRYVIGKSLGLDKVYATPVEYFK
jgi:hypothetical protein